MEHGQYNAFSSALDHNITNLNNQDNLQLPLDARMPVLAAFPFHAPQSAGQPRRMPVGLTL
jgi:hypothetical protein